MAGLAPLTSYHSTVMMHSEWLSRLVSKWCGLQPDGVVPSAATCPFFRVLGELQFAA